MSSLIRTGSVVLKKKVVKSCHCNFDNCYYAFFERSVVLNENKLEPSLPKVVVSQIEIKLDKWF